MKRVKEVAIALGFFLGAFMVADAATGWQALTYLNALHEQFHPVTVGYDAEDGTAQPVGPSTPLPVTGTVTASGGATAANQVTYGGTQALAANQQCNQPAANTKGTFGVVTGSSTTLDAGCTANAYYLGVANLSRTFDIKLNLPDGGSTLLAPNGGSATICKAGATTPDSATLDATCDTCNDGRASIIAACAS